MPVSYSRNMLNNIIALVKLPFRKEKELYKSLHQVIGFYPNHIGFYQQALMHKSASSHEKGKPVNNERLEFLGDAILDAVVGDIVYRRFAGKREGFLTNTRSKIVQRETLNQLAQEMGITRLLKSKDRSSSHNNYIGGNAFEALVGAIYLDKGYDACMKFMEKRILNRLINIDKVAYKEVNFKSKLIEWSQKNRVKLEFRQTDNRKDKEGNSIFDFRVFLESVAGGTGRGYSKKEGQQRAAKETLDLLRRRPQYVEQVFAAKGERTRMEEQPVQTVPDTEPENVVVVQEKPLKDSSKKETRRPKDPATAERRKEKKDRIADEFDLSDITAAPKEPTKEDVIAAAEAAAFEEQREETA